MMVGSRLYIVYDGRAMYDVDAALALFVTKDISEAMDFRQDFADAVIYSYDDSGQVCTDARMEVTADDEVLSSHS